VNIVVDVDVFLVVRPYVHWLESQPMMEVNPRPQILPSTYFTQYTKTKKGKKNMHMTVIDDEHNIQNVVGNNLETSATIITVSNWPEKRLSQ
jgi:hypothetical protein